MAATELSANEDGCNCNGSKEGPVLLMMNKRLRALKKKLNRIVQIEESREQGKPINKEQEDVLKSKVQVFALIEEYERLRQPLLASVKEEVALKEKEWQEQHQRQRQQQQQQQPQQQEQEQEQEKPISSEEKEALASNDSTEGSENDPAEANGNGKVCQMTQEAAEVERAGFEEQLGDLIQLLYFALLFDIKSHGEAQLIWTRYHERSSCLSYDYVADDATSGLRDADLDFLAKFGSMVVSRPSNAAISHKEALERCINHARLWLLNSDEKIHEEMNISYAHLRQRLNRILSSDYFTMTPELQTVTPELQSVTQQLVKAVEPSPTFVEVEHYEHHEAAHEEDAGVEPSGASPPNKPQVDDAGNQSAPNLSSPSEDADEQPAHQTGTGQQQQHQQRRGRGYQGARGGGRGGGYGRGNRGGYPGGGRGGRGNRGGATNSTFQNGGRTGGYQNGRGGIGQYYEQQGGGGYYQQRPPYYGGGGGRRGGRGGHYNTLANGPSPTAAPAAAPAAPAAPAAAQPPATAAAQS